MVQSNWAWVCGAAWAASGCGGNVVDLGKRDTGVLDASGFADAPREAADATKPQTLYESSDVRVYGIGADDTTLYALLDTTEELGRLISCPLDRCSSERRLLAKGIKTPNNSPYATPIVILGDWLYWRHGGGSPADGIAACPKTGCDTPQTMASTFSSDLTWDPEHVYWIDIDGHLMRWRAGESSALQLADLGYQAGQHVVVANDSVYFSDSTGQTISRLPKDGSGAPEIVATGDHISGVALKEQTLYYTSKLLAGSVRSCPSANCQQNADVLVSNQRWPTSLLVQANDAFWVNQIGIRDVGSGQPVGALLGCRVPTCTEPRTWATDFILPDLLEYSDFETGSRFVITQHFVLWLERASFWGSGLRRLPR